MSILFYLKEHFEINEAFGSWEYEVPQNRKELIYDFYLLSYLNPDQFGDDERLINLKIAIKEAKDKITRALIKILGNTIFIACASELLHYPEVIVMDDTRDEVEKGLNAKEKKIFDFYFDAATDEKRQKEPYITRAIKTNEFLKKENISLNDFFNFAIKAFNDDKNWYPDYGGKSWAMIAKSGLRLIGLQDKPVGERQIWIDHAFDLQHNTGSVTTKDDSWAKNGVSD